MGATILTNRAANVVFLASGEPIFLLWEETYEKNCCPHTPKWSVVAVGTIEMVWQYISLAARSCAGGMLQSRRGYIDSVNYIAHWRRLMAKPSVVDGDILFSPLELIPTHGYDGPGKTFRRTPEDKLALLMAIPAFAEAKLRNPDVTRVINLQEDWKVARSLIGYGEGIASAWRAITRRAGSNAHVVEIDLAGLTCQDHSPRPKNQAWECFSFAKDAHNLVFVDQKTKEAILAAEYAVESRAIEQITPTMFIDGAFRSFLSDAKENIRAARESCKLLPEGVVISMVYCGGQNYQIESAQRSIGELQKSHPSMGLTMEGGEFVWAGENAAGHQAYGALHNLMSYRSAMKVRIAMPDENS